MNFVKHYKTISNPGKNLPHSATPYQTLCLGSTFIAFEQRDSAVAECGTVFFRYSFVNHSNNSFGTNKNVIFRV